MAKVALVVVAGDMMHTKTAFDLMRVAQYTSEACGHNVILHHEGGSWISQQRENALNNVLNQGAEWIFWCDSDMRVPLNAIEGLMAHDLPVVAANCVRRKRPISPIARTENKYIDGEMSNDGEHCWTYPDSTGLERVISVGFGVMLTKAEVFHQLEAPFFATPFIPELNRYAGEDTHFCGKCYEAGVPIYIDHDLSWAVRHIGLYEYAHSDALNERELVEQGAWAHEGFTSAGKVEV